MKRTKQRFYISFRRALKRIAVQAAACTAVVGLLCACAAQPARTESGMARYDYPVQIGEVTISQSPARVAVLSPSLADVVTGLGSVYELKLAVRSEDCTAEALSVLPSAGGAQNPDVAMLEQEQVELVLASQPLNEEAQRQLDEKGIATLILPDATTREELIMLYINVASALAGGKSGYEAGQKRAESLLKALDDIKRLIPQEESMVTAGYIVNEQGEFASDASFAGKLFEYAGAVNIAADGGVMTAQELETAGVQYLFCAPGLKETLETSEPFAGLEAVQQGRLIELNEGQMQWQGPVTVLDTVIRMAAAMHPSLESEGLLTPSQPEEETSSGESVLERPQQVDSSSSRQDILILQNRLIELGYMQPPGDGFYGYWTKATVSEFQKRAGLEQTGIADQTTMDILFSADAPTA